MTLYGVFVCFFFFFKQKTAYEITTGDWSSDVCSSDLAAHLKHERSPRKWLRRRPLAISNSPQDCRQYGFRCGLPLSSARRQRRSAPASTTRSAAQSRGIAQEHSAWLRGGSG